MVAPIVFIIMLTCTVYRNKSNQIKSKYQHKTASEQAIHAKAKQLGKRETLYRLVVTVHAMVVNYICYYTPFMNSLNAHDLLQVDQHDIAFDKLVDKLETGDWYSGIFSDKIQCKNSSDISLNNVTMEPLTKVRRNYHKSLAPNFHHLPTITGKLILVRAHFRNF